ncbi:hypothetical protein BH18ACI4_BH18ACI4_12910 [soil metagenome]
MNYHEEFSAHFVDRFLEPRYDQLETEKNMTTPGSGEHVKWCAQGRFSTLWDNADLNSKLHILSPSADHFESVLPGLLPSRREEA